MLSRIVFAVAYLEAAHATGGREAAVRIARERSGGAFDPAVVDAFLRLQAVAEFWRPLDEHAADAFVDAYLSELTNDVVGEFAACCADFVDMKAFWLAGHSRRVGELAERVARRLRLPEARVQEIRLAGMVHDLGLVAVPSFVLNKPADERSEAEQEAFAGHGETLSRMFEGLTALQRIGDIAALHHESASTDCALPDDEIRLAAGIIAAANEFDELTHDAPGAPALSADQALSRLTASFARGQFADAAAAVVAELIQPVPPAGARPSWPAGLTDREVEVLRLLAKGQGRKAIATELVVSESTVRSHLEHIYSKLDVQTRVGAVLFAIENGLVG